jgi:hypothetical protein
MKLKNKEVMDVYTRCLNLVRRKPAEFLVFKKLRYYGLCDYENEVITIDHRKDMLRTAYHECIHYLYPEWSETAVLYAESRVINTVTVLDNARYLKHLSAKIYKSALSQFLSERRVAAKKRKTNGTRNTRRRR